MEKVDRRGGGQFLRKEVADALDHLLAFLLQPPKLRRPFERWPGEPL
jgi:hypothetical protein